MPIAPYVITFSPGSPNSGFVIQPGTVNDTDTTLVLPGYGKVAYGEWLIEDLVRMLENFASATPPVDPVIGQLWYDSTTSQLNVWDGTNYNTFVVKASGVDISFSRSGVLPGGTMVGGYVATRSLSLPINFTGSFARALTGPTLATSIDVNKNGAPVGTIDFAGSSTVGTFTVAAPVSLVAGDVLTFVTGGFDATFSDLIVNIVATLS